MQSVHRRLPLDFKTPWRDGTTHLELTPVDCLERLAALVPRPRLHLIRFHGIRERRSVPLLAAAPRSTEISRLGDRRMSAVPMAENRSMADRGSERRSVPLLAAAL
jgi:hypothetical protein